MKKSPFVALAGNNSAISLMMLTFIGFWVFLGIYQLKHPNAAPTSAPLTEFSSGRAMKHLWVIAEKPHPPGSPEHAAVRDYILKELTAMGLHPEVQRAAVVNLKWIKTWRMRSILTLGRTLSVTPAHGSTR